MYLLKRDYPRAVEYYGYLAVHFPSSKNASAAHWKAGWLSYRQGLYADAARLFDEQIKLYPTAPETVGALYWRGRLYEAQDHAPARAAANYRAISTISMRRCRAHGWWRSATCSRPLCRNWISCNP
jgi:soluble lytic murein transglycosylase